MFPDATRRTRSLGLWVSGPTGNRQETFSISNPVSAHSTAPVQTEAILQSLHAAYARVLRSHSVAPEHVVRSRHQRRLRSRNTRSRHPISGAKLPSFICHAPCRAVAAAGKYCAVPVELWTKRDKPVQHSPGDLGPISDCVCHALLLVPLRW